MASASERQRQRSLAEVHHLSRQGHSQRAIARQLRLHRQTVKAWFQEEPLPLEELVSAEAIGRAEPAQPARRQAYRAVALCRGPSLG